MAICSYLVLSADGAARTLKDRLAALPDCEEVQTASPDVLLLVTDTAGPDEERALRERVASLDGVRAMVLVFGEIAPDAPMTDSPRGTLQ